MSNEIKGGLYIDFLMTVQYSHGALKGRDCSWRTVMKLRRVVFVHGEQTQSRLLEKTH